MLAMVFFVKLCQNCLIPVFARSLSLYTEFIETEQNSEDPGRWHHGRVQTPENATHAQAAFAQA
ncbi:hypothetical protein UNDYM_5189 [Undibacterium sp. YM2]|nr:hypothetical protein UNDYM_5189 [Undibacterium sp. YM2]